MTKPDGKARKKRIDDANAVVKVNPDIAFEAYWQMGPGRSMQALEDVLRERYGEFAPSRVTLSRWANGHTGRVSGDASPTWAHRIEHIDRMSAQRAAMLMAEKDAKTRVEQIDRLRALCNTAITQLEHMIYGTGDGVGIGRVNLEKPTTLDVRRLGQAVADLFSLADRLAGMRPPEDDPGLTESDVQAELDKVDAYRQLLEQRREQAKRRRVIDQTGDGDL